METFQEAGVQMLKEFRALLQHSPLPLPGTRLLQLLALNMFAIESTQLKGESSIFLFCSSSSSSWSSSPPHSPVDFPPRSTNFLLFPTQPAENRDGEFWNSRLLSRNYSCIHGEGRLQVWIMRYVTDGIDTFADSRFEFRWIFARVKCVKFRACIYVYTVESSRRCSGIFNFFSRILFREFPLFFIYNLSKNYFS